MLIVMSHSLRSAWIEILTLIVLPPFIQVALLTECVDRNDYLTGNNAVKVGRTPYGVRG